MSGFHSKSSGHGGSFPHDIRTKSGLTNLYNKQVVSSQPVERPLDAFNGGRIGRVGVLGANAAGISTSYSGQRDRAMHSGTLITTSDGGKWLVHKGKEGKSFDTVVTDAKHMHPDTWRPAGPQQNVGGRASVSDFVKAGGAKYDVRGANCHDATRNMQKLGK
ncbi:uncharacterized protein LOC114529473 [Dendronephthya gigantea]|uniref:uncharacterized protein LOC114529473 n=1 Tax=Dendronephthya gigantea TaxID=151771 RepID=UPI00106D3F64|nr:uncharacterized protein LOC114529473 [Dendronephthya gigantea]